ncbi:MULTISPECIES: hypothetical protein [unclassified Lonepinella]|uniref:hypothetical protein n=1 Tax=unclassified Lonepinella TaxID=2642006 RepID=UPI0036D9C337
MKKLTATALLTAFFALNSSSALAISDTQKLQRVEKAIENEQFLLPSSKSEQENMDAIAMQYELDLLEKGNPDAKTYYLMLQITRDKPIEEQTIYLKELLKWKKSCKTNSQGTGCHNWNDFKKMANKK